MVAITGFARNMNHIVLGTDDERIAGFGARRHVGIAVIFAINVLANTLSRRTPAALQHVASGIINPLFTVLLDRHAPQSRVLEGRHLARSLAQRQAADQR